eukprot:scaffold1531_cov296-Prasinococcus_capsulatus_cf.AAC.7
MELAAACATHRLDHRPAARALACAVSTTIDGDMSLDSGTSNPRAVLRQARATLTCQARSPTYKVYA